MSNKDEEVRKYLQNKFDPNAQYEKLKTYKNAANSAQFALDRQEEFKVNLKPDTSVSRGVFLPTLMPNEYRAHPITIRAMRKEIFMGGDEFIDLECLYTCASCKKEVDMQFWHFCPYCEASFHCK